MFGMLLPSRLNPYRIVRYIPKSDAEYRAFPDEILLKIFGFLDVSYLARVVPFVNRQFMNVSNDESLYKAAYEKIAKKYDDLHVRFGSYKRAALVMRRGFCFACGSRKGVLIPMSYNTYFRVCHPCRDAKCGYRLISKDFAKRKYFLNDDDFKDIDRKLEQRITYYNGTRPRSMYVVADVRNVAYAKRGGRENFLEIKKLVKQQRITKAQEDNLET